MQSITKEYRFRSKRLLVLDQLDFTIKSDSFISIVGESGSGKTTLLNIISGIVKPTSGTIYFNGQKAKRFFDRSTSRFRSDNLGFVFQQFNLIPYQTVLENVIIPLKFSSHPPKVHKQKGLELLNQMGLYDKKDYFPNLLSGGQMQRVAIARALIKQPKVIVADEPTGNLDQKTAKDIIELFAKLNNEHNMSFVIVTHDSDIIDRAKEKYRLVDKTLKRYE